MTVPAEMINKMEAMPEAELAIVFGLVDQLSRKPTTIFEDLRNDGMRNPMIEDEVDDIVSSVRRDRRAAGN